MVKARGAYRALNRLTICARASFLRIMTLATGCADSFLN